MFKEDDDADTDMVPNKECDDPDENKTKMNIIMILTILQTKKMMILINVLSKIVTETRIVPQQTQEGW